MADDGPAPSGLAAAALVATLAYVAIGLFAALALAPRTFYADPWRFAGRQAQEPFWVAVFAADNGHREAVPNFVRVLELRLLDGLPLLQGAVGLAALVAAALVARRALADRGPAVRAAAALALAAGVCWGGNARKLAHGSETVHLGLVLLALAAGLRALTARRTVDDLRAPAVAASWSLFATMCFGSGLALAPAFAVVLWLQRAPRRCYAPLALAALVGAAAVMVASDDPLPRPATDAANLLDFWLRWLGAPSAWALSPALDPAHAARLPFEWLRALATTVASPLDAAFGPALAARWPACAFGLLAVAWLGRASWRARRDGAPGLALFGLGMAWCGAGIGALVVLARRDYFVELPVQLTTQRYLPWSMLAWTGLVLQATATAADGRRALLGALAFAVALAPSNVWTLRFMYRQRVIAEATAAGAVVGVIGRDFPLEETDPDDLRAAIPPLRAARKGPFAWPEASWLGRPAAEAPTRLPEPLVDLAVRPVDNRLAGPGREARFRGPTGSARLLLVEGDRVVGLAVRAPFDDAWHGWLQGDGGQTPAPLRAVALRSE